MVRVLKKSFSAISAVVCSLQISCSTQPWKKKSFSDLMESVKITFKEVYLQFENDTDIECLERLESFVRKEKMSQKEFSNWVKKAREEFFPSVWIRSSELLEMHLSQFI